MIDSILYSGLAWGAIAAGFLAAAAMFRNAFRWRGRKMGLRLLSGATCGYVASVYLHLEIATYPDERVIASLLIRPAVFVMLTLALTFSIADY